MRNWKKILVDRFPLIRVLASCLLCFRYKFYVASTERDKNLCIQLRYDIFNEELQRNAPGEVIYGQEDQLDTHSILIACEDRWTNQIIGCGRITNAKDASTYPGYFKEYQLNIVPKNILSKIAIASRVCIKKKYRTGIISYLLFQKMYEELLNNHFKILFLVCEPGLYPRYGSIGFSHYGHIFQPAFGGYEIPIYEIVDNYEFLKKHAYELYLIAKKKGFPNLSSDIDEFKHKLATMAKMDPGLKLITDPTPYINKCSLTEGLSEKGKLSIFKHAILIKPNKNDLIIRQGSGEKYISFINKGSFEVVINNKVISLLSEGDVFGEIAFLKRIFRTANVISKSDDSEIILFGYNFMSELNKSDNEILTAHLKKIANERIKTINKLENHPFIDLKEDCL